LTFLSGKKILITGGTGSLGSALTKRLLKTDVEKIRLYSRDELKQVEMKSTLNDDRLRFLIGDVRDSDRLSRALQDIDIVIHTAALKHVPVVEYNPFEAVKTNVIGTQNLIDGCFKNNIKFALGVGTDKAVSPLNTYGATKLLMERLFVSSNYYKGSQKINFSCVRYGNVLGSRGSIVPTFVNKIQKNEKIMITDPNMTRFNITMNQALDLIFRVLENGHGGDVHVPKLKSYKVGDITEVILDLLDSKQEIEITGIRPGEKLHEELISKNEIRNVYETNDDYVIFDSQTQNDNIIDNNPNIKKIHLETEYSSDNVELLSKEELKQILINEKLIPQLE
jgi:UDP-N-acetylglucosamine 4,6-dehydratase/UDP-glucose 4-epimerase